MPMAARTVMTRRRPRGWLRSPDSPAVDYELSDADAEPGHGANGAGLDLDVGTATVPDTAFTATQKLSAEDLALPDLEPVTMSEVGTKLDLARAYMDMGDPEGARNILEEVMHEGSVAQRQEARAPHGVASWYAPPAAAGHVPVPG